MKSIHIVHLYAEEMNIYGDNGNVQVLVKRLHDRGYSTKVSRIGVGQDLPDGVHMVIGGGGQDAGQERVAKDLLTKEVALKKLVEANVPMLMICGMYQLFGAYFLTADGIKIPGLGIFDAYTIAKKGRIIGNITSETAWGQLVGYENHSGRTILGATAQPLGKVGKGLGNNAEDKSEGIIMGTVFGSYMHGPVLAKSPAFTDHLISLAIMASDQQVNLSQLDDNLELMAAKVAQNRPR